MKIGTIKRCGCCLNYIPGDAKYCCFCGVSVIPASQEHDKKDLAPALKNAMNSVYCLTSASFDNPFRGQYRYQATVGSVYDPMRAILVPKVKRIEILNPEKVLRFTFRDGAQIKTICSKDDTFDSELACYIAYAKILNKKFYHNTYTADGTVRLATALKYEKCYEKLVNKAMKIYAEERMATQNEN